MSLAEYKRHMTASKQKYGSRKTEIDGHIFDSQIEARYYLQLKWLLENKEIKSFELQPRYLLQEAFRKNGKLHRKIEYVADFEVIHRDGTVEVIDVKGYQTADFRIKRKLFEKRYPHRLSLVTYVKKYGGWIELDELEKLRRKEKRARRKKSDFAG